MKTVWYYLKEHFKEICLYLCFTGIFAIVFYLYGIPTDTVRYAFVLGFVMLACYGGINFVRTDIKHKRLLEIEQHLNAEWVQLPAALDRVETDYQRMLEATFKSRQECTSKAVISRQDMQDYYSLWAHQIKTPIAAMRVLLQAEEETRSEIHLHYRKELKMELFKIEQYVEMVLSYLRMEEMNADLVLNWYPVDELVRQAIRKYSQMFIFQKIELDFQSSSEMVLTDEKWFVFVVEQILSNALKYTKSGKISIYMTKEPEKKQLVIEDTGIGIQQEDLPRVFEKGFTGYNGREDRKSTGIGLYLCKSVIDKLNHGIQIESEVGTGTKVLLAVGRKEWIHE